MKGKVFISGPYTLGDVAQNVAAAIRAADKLMDAGYVPYVPHLSHLQHLLRPRPYEDWLAVDLEWLAVCDCVVRLPGPSRGADGETAWAVEHGKPVYSLSDLLLQPMSPGGSE